MALRCALFGSRAPRLVDDDFKADKSVPRIRVRGGQPLNLRCKCLHTVLQQHNFTDAGDYIAKRGH